jgi:pumilio homology domain family member 6
MAGGSSGKGKKAIQKKAHKDSVNKAKKFAIKSAKSEALSAKSSIEGKKPARPASANNVKKNGSSGSNGKKASYQKSWAKYSVKKSKEDGDKASSGKVLNKKERAALKPNFQLVEDLKSSWNTVRDRSTSEETRQLLLSKMLKQMTGHTLQVTLRHDASRITQCLLQFGSVEQRTVILKEILPRIIEMSKTPYGHFVVLKALTYCKFSALSCYFIHGMTKQWSH